MTEHPNPRGVFPVPRGSFKDALRTIDWSVAETSTVFPVPPTAAEVAEFLDREWKEAQRKLAVQRAVQHAVRVVSRK